MVFKLCSHLDFHSFTYVYYVISSLSCPLKALGVAQGRVERFN